MIEKLTVSEQPIVQPIIEHGGHYRLINTVIYTWGIKQIVINKGLIFDGASVPYLLRIFLSPMDTRVVSSSLIHDCLYEHPNLEGVGHYYEGGALVNRTFSKLEADDLFRAANIANNMDWFRTFLAYLAVRFFGKGTFK